MEEARPFVCAICLGSIPAERDDTVVWEDVRLLVGEKTVDGKVALGPFLTAHPACFEGVKPLMNTPCPSCGRAIAPIDSEKPRRARWAGGSCGPVFVRGLLGKLKMISGPTPPRLRSDFEKPAEGFGR
jgi:hypothetical protein